MRPGLRWDRVLVRTEEWGKEWAGVEREGRSRGRGGRAGEGDASTGCSSLSTDLVDYGHLTERPTPFQPHSKGAVW